MKGDIKKAILLSFLLFVVYSVTDYAFHKKVKITGDEPHYLLMAKTIWEKHTIDLKQSYEDKHFYEVFYKKEISPHVSPNSKGHKWYSFHQYGFPILLIPAVIVGKALGRYALPAYFFMSFLLSLSSVFIYYLVREYSGLSTAKATLITCGVFLSIPLLVFSKLIYTEVPAFLMVLILLWYLLAAEKEKMGSALHITIIGLLIGSLPWLHVKYVILSGGFLLVFLIKKVENKYKVLFAITSTMPILLVLVFFKALYGAFSFSAQFQGSLLSLRYFINGILGLLVDQQFGLFTNSPIYILAVPGLVIFVKRRDSDFFVHFLLACTVFAFLVLCAMVGGHGWQAWTGCIVARPTIPVLPIFIILIATFLKHTNSRLLIPISTLSVLYGLFVLIKYPHTMLIREATVFEEGNPFLFEFATYDFDIRKIMPNLLSVEHELLNIVLASSALAGIICVNLLAAKRKKHILGFVLLPFAVYTGLATHNLISNREQTSYFIPAYPLWTQCGEKNVLNNTIESLSDARNCAMAYGPYKFFLKGRYRAIFLLDYQPINGDKKYKEIIVDAASGVCKKTYESRHIDARSLKEGENRLSIDFYNSEPTCPLELRVFIGGWPIYKLVLKGVELKYIGNE